MSTRSRIAGLAGIALVTMLALVGLATYGLSSAGRLIDRAGAAQQRMAQIAALQAGIEAYAEKAAAVLLVGREELDALGTARIAVERGFADLTRATRQEIATLADMQQIQKALPEVEAGRKMLEVYHSIDLATNQALALQRQGQRQESIDQFRRDVEFRIANELEPQLRAALHDATAELGILQAEQADAQRRLRIAAGLVLVIGLAASIALGAGLRRSLARRHARLRDAAGALASGDFDRSIAIAGADPPASPAHDVAVAAEAAKSRLTRLEEVMATVAADRDGIARQRDEALARLDGIENRRAQFIADIGHELRTPLTILRGEADVALRGPSEPDAQRDALERISGQAAELGMLLEEMIAYARSDGEGRPEAMAELPLAELVRAAAQEGELLAEPREITIEVRLGDGGSRVVADFRRLRQALLIGIDNAVKHSAPGGRIGLETDRHEAQALIRVLDNGPGIGPEDQPRVFERFFRGHGEAENLSDGLGIGLAIAREIIDRHAGTIRLDNRPEGGAVLEVALPIAGSRR